MRKRLKEYKDYIDNYLDSSCFQYDNEPQQELFKSMRYSLLAGGKRLRPVFVFEFCRMCGGNWEDATAFAAAIEMIHTYSLIHDDLPCMDDDAYRRGNLSNHIVFGEATAVLAGDALLTAAFSYIAKAPFSAETRIRAVEVLSECAGELGMVGGQVLDISSEQRECTEQEVLDIHSRKTGALIRAACILGVLAGGGCQKDIQAAAEYASHFGLAFQIRDDVLDRVGDPQEMGKSVFSDDAKNTFVRLYGIDECYRMICSHTDEAVEALSSFSDNWFMIALTDFLSGRRK